MAFHNPTSKLERAFRNLFICAGIGAYDDSYVSLDTRERHLPSRSFIVSAVQPIQTYRFEFICSLEIQHKFSMPEATSEAGYETARQAMDEYVSDCLDFIFSFGDGQQLTKLADAVTNAGRDLATLNPNLSDPAEIAQDKIIAAANADMLAFRCDEISLPVNFWTRGKSEADGVWNEIIHLQARVSNAAISN